MGERAGRLLRRAAVAVLLAAAVFYFVWGGEYTLLDVRELSSERDSLGARADSLRAVAESLEARAAVLDTSDFAVERVARERYGFLRDGEALFRFVEAEADSAEDAPR